MASEYEAWKASQAYPWAESVRKTTKRLMEREAALDELRSRYDGLKAVRYDRQGGGTMMSGDEAMARFIEDLDYMRRNWSDALQEWRDEVSEFEKALRRIDGASDQLLTARYVRNKHWSEIADAMGYAESYVKGELKIRALSDLYDAMPPHMRALPKAEEE